MLEVAGLLGHLQLYRGILGADSFRPTSTSPSTDRCLGRLRSEQRRSRRTQRTSSFFGRAERDPLLCLRATIRLDRLVSWS